MTSLPHPVDEQALLDHLRRHWVIVGHSENRVMMCRTMSTVPPKSEQHGSVKPHHS